jgi:hypothetical protein
MLRLVAKRETRPIPSLISLGERALDKQTNLLDLGTNRVTVTDVSSPATETSTLRPLHTTQGRWLYNGFAAGTLV